MDDDAALQFGVLALSTQFLLRVVMVDFFSTLIWMQICPLAQQRPLSIYEDANVKI